MATAADISATKQRMPRPITLTDDQIGEVIDARGGMTQALSFFWEGNAAELAGLVDVEESGSSRKMSQAAKQAKEMADYWTGKSNAEIAALAASPTTRPMVRG